MLFRQAWSAHDTLRILSEYQRNLVFHLPDLLPRGRNDCRGCIDELLGLTQIKQGADASGLPLLRQLEEILAIF